MQAIRWIAGAVALVGATVVAAQNVADRPTKEQREAARAQAFTQADGDGQVTQDELAAAHMGKHGCHKGAGA